MKHSLTIAATNGVVQLILLAVILAVATSFADCGSLESTIEENNEICTTAECIDTASRILSYMNPEIDPCEDFYHFACGGFDNSTTIPENKSVVDAFSVLEDLVAERLKGSLEASSTLDEPKTFTLLRNIYESCVNETAIEAAGLDPMLNVIKELGNWPLLVGDSWDENAFTWTEGIHKLRTLGFSVYYFISFWLNPDPADTTKRIIGLDQPTFYLDREYLALGWDNENVQAYYNLMVDIAVIYGADQETASQELRESLEFEIQLANNSLPNDERDDFTLLHNPMTVAELKKNYSSVDWKEYINNLLSWPTLVVDDDELINVYEPSYLSKLEVILSTTPKRTQANFLSIRAILDSVDYLNEAIRNRVFEFASFMYGITQPPARWKKCLNIISETMNVGIGALYVREYSSEETNNITIEMVDEIKSDFTQILEEADWMDNATREIALEKITALYYHIGYPVELLDDNALDGYYDILEFSSNDFFGNYRNASRFSIDSAVRTLRDPINKTSWISHSDASVINAYYSYEENSISILAAFLQGVFFNKDRPQYMNYGSLGIVIGHEMTHGFDNLGSQYDDEGNLVNWWNSDTKKKFLEKAECIVDQYGNYTDESLGLAINGINTESENIADNAGTKIAYRTYSKWVEKNGPEPKLPGLEYTPKQLFWFSLANIWCAKYTPETLKNRILTNVHSPPQFRVNGPFSNRPEFAADFNCPVGSTMNPEQKCSVW